MKHPNGPRWFAAATEADEILCACVHRDAQDCARIRDGFEPDDRRYWMYKRRCECVCHNRYDDEDDD